MHAWERPARVQWFQEVTRRHGLTLNPAFNLVAELPIPQPQFHALREAVMRYIRACLGRPHDARPEQAILEEAASSLANRTPNGILMPKREFQREFNALQKVMADWLRGVGIDDLIAQICCPIVLRLATGESNPQLEQSRPYSSSKLHSDIWTGEPPDFVGVRIPVAGDIARTTIDFFHPPEDFETRYLRLLKDYDDARELTDRSPRYPLTMRHGCAYFVDGTVIHQTVKKNGGARVTLQVELRRQSSDADRQAADRRTDPCRLKNYLPREEWYAYGTTKFMRPKDTYADAAKGVFVKRPAEEPMYETVDQL